MTSKFEKVEAYTKGCIVRRDKNLYQSLKHFTSDLQTIMNFDPESSSVIFKQYPEIKFSYSRDNQQGNIVKVQCCRCGIYKVPYIYCLICSDKHYCSEVCEINVKLTHEKEQCKINSYPKIQHSILIQVHFGTNLGSNIQIYFQHETRAYALVRGKQIIKQIYQYFSSVKKTSNSDIRASDRHSRMEQKIMGYTIELKNNEKYVNFQKGTKDYPTGVLKVDLQNMEQLKRIYQQNELLEEIEIYLLRNGALMTHSAEEVHNNHAHWVYIFRMP